MSQGDLLAHHNIRHDKEEYMSGGIFCVSSCQNFLMAISFHLTGKSLDTKWLNPSARNSTGNEPPAHTTLITCLRKENSLEKQARARSGKARTRSHGIPGCWSSQTLSSNFASASETGRRLFILRQLEGSPTADQTQRQHHRFGM